MEQGYKDSNLNVVDVLVWVIDYFYVYFSCMIQVWYYDETKGKLKH